MSRITTNTWDEETHTASCIIEYNNNSFYGIAVCAEDDLDMCNALTGQTIAESRASIKVLQHQKNNEIKPKLQALNQLYYTMKHSTHFNPDSYEAHTLMKQIKYAEDDLIVVKELIKEEREALRTYINNKDEFYQQIRKMRGTKHD